MKKLILLTLLTLGGFAAVATYANAQDTKDAATATPDFGLTGFATMEGGTTGGGDGELVVARTAEKLTDYAGRKHPLTILVKGTLIGSAGSR
ncbi:MAG: hypothetical protein PVJ86_02220 [Phycisphaerales bacterium]|jgi:pectate lyase